MRSTRIGYGIVLGWCGLVVAGAALATVDARVSAQAPDQRIWNGVFSAEQAERGKGQFETNCGSCHGSKANSDRSGPALWGDRFMKAWEFNGLNQLVSKVFDTMPQGYPSNVQESVKLDIISYLLQENGFPAGSAPLSADLDQLREVQIVRKGVEGARAVSNFSLVQVVGCLSQGANNAWMITHTADPVATTSPDPSSAETLKAAGEKPLGAATFQLVNAARLHPETHTGQKIEAKGLLYRAPNDDRISVSSMQVIAAGCAN